VTWPSDSTLGKVMIVLPRRDVAGGMAALVEYTVNCAGFRLLFLFLICGCGRRGGFDGLFQLSGHVLGVT
jgi:hypothetical protein